MSDPVCSPQTKQSREGNPNTAHPHLEMTPKSSPQEHCQANRAGTSKHTGSNADITVMKEVGSLSSLFSEVPFHPKDKLL